MEIAGPHNIPLSKVSNFHPYKCQCDFETLEQNPLVTVTFFIFVLHLNAGEVRCKLMLQWQTQCTVPTSARANFSARVLCDCALNQSKSL